MNTRNFAVYVCLVFALTFTACNEEKAIEPPSKSDPVGKIDPASKTDDLAPLPASEKLPEAPLEKNTSPLNTPKNSLSFQIELLKSGNVEKLKTCFTERLRDRVTVEAVAKGREELSNHTLDDLYASEERGEYEGSETCKVKMKSGRTLTTLKVQNGEWLADTVWFK
ncbi:hypothetical protein N9Z47_01480 [bacterium]|nr:hypothetical protein [bacterium]MDA7905711.1 hypothetical protein [Mariniblastus sp.]MDB4386011.1 hypothetical protein [bacterium]